MSMMLNRSAYEQLIKEDIKWLLKQPRTLERDHIELILNTSADLVYCDCQKCMDKRMKESRP